MIVTCRYVLAFLMLTYSLIGFGKGVVVTELSFHCNGGDTCIELEDKWQSIIGPYFGMADLKQQMKLLLDEAEYDHLSYKFVQKGENTIVNVWMDVRPIVNEIEFVVQNDIEEHKLRKILPLKEGAYLRNDLLKYAVNVIKKFLSERGYNKAAVTYEVIKDEGDFNIKFMINLGRPLIIKEIQILAPNKGLEELVRNRLKRFIGAPYNFPEIKIIINQLRDELFKNGHFFSRIDILKEIFSEEENTIIFRPKINLGDKHIFSLKGNKYFRNQDIMQKIYNFTKKRIQEFNINDVIKHIIEFYNEHGIFNTKINFYIRTQKNINDIMTHNYFIEIVEGKKIKVENILFNGNKYFESEKLTEIFYKDASVKAERNFYDPSYIEKASQIIEKYYIEQGFLFAKVSEPTVHFYDRNRKANIVFNIKEGRQTQLAQINYFGIPKDISDKLRSKMVNKEGGPLNTVKLDNDLELVVDELRKQGHYFASIQESGPEEIVSYTDSYRSATLNIHISLGQKIILHDIFVIGNIQTKDIVILREIHLSQGDLVTPEVLENITARLSGLGIFSNIKIEVRQIVPHRSEANLLINVKEQKSGSIVLSPGFRSDIGLKLGVEVGHKNIMKMNRTLSMKGQISRRLHNRNLDPKRQKTDIKFLEYSGRVNFTEPYLLGYPYIFQTSATGARKRLFLFDADILRANIGLSKIWNRFFESSLAYQLERVEQRNATEPEDNTHLRIGSIIPNLVFDFRDDSIRPTKGALFDLLYEYADPNLFSQGGVGEEIKFYSLVSRNAFYYPVTDDVVLALSLAAGRQKNLAKGMNGLKTKIPTIKVFRLNGIDLVRGYQEEEINRIRDNDGNIQDISELAIRDEAYFINTKLELRFYLDENIVLGPFLDAGRLYYDKFRNLSLKSTAGLTFKYLTPVGSLDLDYGIKLFRRRINGELERPGELHISIGFF